MRRGARNRNPWLAYAISSNRRRSSTESSSRSATGRRKNHGSRRQLAAHFTPRLVGGLCVSHLRAENGSSSPFVGWTRLARLPLFRRGSSGDARDRRGANRRALARRAPWMVIANAVASSTSQEIAEQPFQLGHLPR